jgi:hypothetical protein
MRLSALRNWILSHGNKFHQELEYIYPTNKKQTFCYRNTLKSAVRCQVQAIELKVLKDKENHDEVRK